MSVHRNRLRRGSSPPPAWFPLRSSGSTLRRSLLSVVFADLTLYTLCFIFAPPGHPASHQREIREILAFEGPPSLSSVRSVGLSRWGLHDPRAAHGPRHHQLLLACLPARHGCLAQDQRHHLSVRRFRSTRAPAHIVDVQAIRRRMTHGGAMVTLPLLAFARRRGAHRRSMGTRPALAASSRSHASPHDMARLCPELGDHGFGALILCRRKATSASRLGRRVPHR